MLEYYPAGMGESAHVVCAARIATCRRDLEEVRLGRGLERPQLFTCRGVGRYSVVPSVRAGRCSPSSSPGIVATVRTRRGVPEMLQWSGN